MPPEAAFKISIPIGDLAGRENWSRALSTARLSGHRNFTEQNRTPDAILRPLKSATKVTACAELKILLPHSTLRPDRRQRLSRCRAAYGSRQTPSSKARKPRASLYSSILCYTCNSRASSLSEPAMGRKSGYCRPRALSLQLILWLAAIGMFNI